MTSQDNQKSDESIDLVDSQEYIYEIKIPKDRVAVLIGTKGSVKKRIESETKTKINKENKNKIILAGKSLKKIKVYCSKLSLTLFIGIKTTSVKPIRIISKLK